MKDTANSPDTSVEALEKSQERTTQETDWAAWMRELGRHKRRARELLGISQERLARMAGVSQGAVSRLEAGRGLATPLLVVLKIDLAMREVFAVMDPELLSPEAQRLTAATNWHGPHPNGGSLRDAPLLKEAELEALINLYHKLPARQRGKLVAVVRATVTAIAGRVAP